MKKSKLAIVFSILALIFIIGFSGLYFYVSTKISPEEIRKLTISELQKIFPHAEINLGKIDYSIGLTVKLKAEALSMKYPRGGQKYNLFEVKDFNVYIPIMSIIKTSGTIRIAVENPKLGYYEFTNGNSWTLAMGKGKEGAAGAADKSAGAGAGGESPSTMALPAIMGQIFMNLQISNMVVDYESKDQKRGNILIEKMLIKNININTATAFEVSSALTFSSREK